MHTFISMSMMNILRNAIHFYDNLVRLIFTHLILLNKVRIGVCAKWIWLDCPPLLRVMLNEKGVEMEPENYIDKFVGWFWSFILSKLYWVLGSTEDFFFSHFKMNLVPIKITVTIILEEIQKKGMSSNSKFCQ